jgi:hypothetical protein
MRLIHLPQPLIAALIFSGGSLGGCANDPSPAAPTASAMLPAPAADDATRVPQRPPNEAIRAELEAAQHKGDDGAASANTNASGTAAASTDADGGAPATADPDGGTTSKAGPTNATANAANANVDLERRDYETKSRERLARIDTRAREAQQRGGKLTATKKTLFDTAYHRFADARADIETKLAALHGGDWKTAKANAERSFDDLEGTLTRLDDNL